MKIRTPKGPRRTAREAIVDAAVVVLAASPAASMAAVAESAGVGRATLYRHFPSREALVKELFFESIRATNEAVAPVFDAYDNADQALLAMLEALIPLGDRFHFLASETQVAEDPEVVAESERQLAGLTDFVEQAKLEGTFAKDLPTAWIVATIDSMIWTAWLSMHRGELAANGLAELVFRTLTDGMKPR